MTQNRKIAFGGITQTGIVPKTYTLQEILRASPTITHVVELLSGEGVDCKVGKGFASFQFYGNAGRSGAEEIAKADYVAAAVNGLRPKHVFEQIAAVRGAAVSIDVDQLRRVQTIINAERLIADAHSPLDAHKRMEGIKAIEEMIAVKRGQMAPVYEGFDEPIRAKRATVRRADA